MLKFFYRKLRGIVNKVVGIFGTLEIKNILKTRHIVQLKFFVFAF